MAWICRIGLCFGIISLCVPGSNQQSPSTLFLVSVPEEIYAGMPMSLAVTVLADFSVRVTAELAQGNIKTEKSEDFTQDMTGLLILPPIYESNPKSSAFTLTVKGYKGDEVIYTNTTIIAFNPRNVTTFIQTDRLHYQPGDTVRVRVASVYLDNYPFHGKVDLSINNPNGNTADKSQSSGNNGIVLREFTLSQAAPLGQWTVITTINGLTDQLTFLVEHFENPPFEVLFHTPSYVLAEEDISGSVRALYSSGQPVHGTVKVTLLLVTTAENDDTTFVLIQTKEIYGSTQFLFSKNDLEPLNAIVQSGQDVMVYVHAAVTGNSTVNQGIEVTKQVMVQISREIYRLMLQGYPQTLKPGLEFYAKLKIARFDEQPLSSVDVKDSAVIEITQRTSTDDGEPTSLTLPVPQDGIVHISFRLQAEVETLFIRASYQSRVVTLEISETHPSPTGSYIGISPISSTQIGLPVQISVESSVQPKQLHYVVKSRGQIVAAGTKEYGSFSLTPTVAWVPQACVTVYCVLTNGEVMSDTADLLVQQQEISLSWSSDKAQPGEQVTLSVTGPESGSEIGIVIMGTQDSAPEVSQEFEVEQECNVRMMTNGKLYETQKPGASTQDSNMITKYWHHFMDGAEPLLWLDATISDSKWTSEKITVPDGVNSLRAAAFVMSQRQGLGFSSQKLSVTKDFSLSLNVPPYLIRGEEIVLEVNIINHLHSDLEVILLLAESDAFEFVMAQRGDLSVVNAQKLTLGSHVSAKAMFPVRLTALGEVDISVDAVSTDASESLVWTVLVKPEGIEESVSENLFLELPPTMSNHSMSTAFSFPPGVISDTRRAHVAIGGDILALSIHHLNSLVDLPLGCGEQNMVHFAPSIYVLRYLVASGQDDANIKSRAMQYLEEGYQRQLSYQRSDGSFGAFGASDSSGNTWLTAFVVKCFQQAQGYIQVDQKVLTKATDWLLSQQGAQGEFSEAGKPMHSEMQAGLDNGPVALTAYVLITILEDSANAERYADQVSLAKSYLENKVSTEVVSNYSLSLAAYALSLASSAVASSVMEELSRRADFKDGARIWMSSGGTESHDLEPHSVQIEITAYILLAYFKRGDIVEAISLMKWLSSQRNHLGGFVSTQDTVVALQALAHFAAFSGAIAIDLRLKITAPTTSFVSIYQINSTNYRMYQGQEIVADNDLKLDIYMEGRGFATFQMNVFYNLDSKTFSENLQNIINAEAFVLNVEVHAEGDDYNHLQLSVCMRLKDSQVISQTGMVILDVGMLSGFTIPPETTAPTGLIPKIEMVSDKVILYLYSEVRGFDFCTIQQGWSQAQINGNRRVLCQEGLNTTEVCVQLPLMRIYKVAHIQDAVVRVYDYYEPTRKATRTYNLDDLRTMESCVFCGEDCELCKPGLSIIVAGITSHSVISATYSLSCLVITALFMVV